MGATPQSNATLPQVAEALARWEGTFCLCGHLNPDGDCLGSELALALALEALGKPVVRLLAQDAEPDRRLGFLPGFDKLMPASRYEGPCDVFVAVDVPTRERLSEAAAVHARAQRTVTVDHHAVDEAMSQLSYTDPDVAATAQLVWELAGLMGVARGSAIATCSYTGLMTDTGRFQYQNADASAFAAAAEMVAAGADAAAIARSVYQQRTIASVRLEGVAIEHLRLLADGQASLSWVTAEDMARLGAVKADAEPLIDALRSIEGVRLACMLREEGGIVRGSLRAKDGTDVSALARRYGGGGHKAAAGFTFEGTLAQAIEVVSRDLAALASAPGEP